MATKTVFTNCELKIFVYEGNQNILLNCKRVDGNQQIFTFLFSAFETCSIITHSKSCTAFTACGPLVTVRHIACLVYSCCSHLEHRASVKRFVSLQFLNLRRSVELFGRVISPSQGRYLTQTQNKHKQTSMLRVGFEPTIPAFERAKTVHGLDRAATVIGVRHINYVLKL
jgi:hypothetical protein